MVPRSPSGAAPAPVSEGHRRHDGRGLCSSCYAAARQSGELIEHERVTRPRDEVLEDWAILRAQGHTLTQAAPRIGIPYGSLRDAVRRARLAGDPRALA